MRVNLEVTVYFDDTLEISNEEKADMIVNAFEQGISDSELEYDDLELTVLSEDGDE